MTYSAPFRICVSFICLLLGFVTGCGQPAVATANQADDLYQWQREFDAAINERRYDDAEEISGNRIASAPREWYPYFCRGIARFLGAEITGCLEDFDEAHQRYPQIIPQNWQRGIALYYAERYEDGCEQFTDHRTVNRDDVENSAWHFLCNAKLVGVQQAAKEVFGSEGDGRFPLMLVLDLYRDEITVDEFMEQFEANPKSRNAQAQQYAFLYLGLYYEAHEEPALAKKYILKANESPLTNYMAEVGRVHATIRGWDEGEQP